MSEREQTDGRVYSCPMHKDVRQAGPGKCPKCGMALLPEGTRFAIVRHILAGPMPIVIITAAIIAVLVLAVLMQR